MRNGLWEDTTSKRRKRYEYIIRESELLSIPLKDSVYIKNDTDADEIVIRDVTTYVLAPAMNDFILWVLGSAIKKGHRRLYFLARDGYFMYKTALVYCEKLGLDIDCRYLSCSRYSVRVPMYHMDMEEALDYICRGGIDVTFDKVLGRAGLDSDAKKALGNRLLDRWDTPDVIPYSSLGELKKDLSCDRSFMEMAEEVSKQRFPDLKGYLEDEGLLEDIPCALVDSGWTGSMQKVLSKLLGKIKDDGKLVRLQGYYWGLYELPADVDPEDYYCYFFAPGYGAKRKTGFSNCLFEGVFSAPHGMTLCYEKMREKMGNDSLSAGDTPAERGDRKERIVPVYADIREDNLQFNRMTEKHLSAYTEKLCEVIKIKTGENASPGKDINRLFLKTVSSLRTQSTCCEHQRMGKICKLLSSGKGIVCQRGNTGAGKRSTFKKYTDREVVSRLMETFMSTPTVREAEVYGALPFSDDVLDENEQQIAARLTPEELRSNHPWRKAAIMLGISKGRLKESAWYEGSAVRSGTGIRRNLTAYKLYKMMVYIKKEAARLGAVIKNN